MEVIVEAMTTELIPLFSPYDSMIEPLNVIAPHGPPPELSNMSGLIIIGPFQ